MREEGRKNGGMKKGKERKGGRKTRRNERKKEKEGRSGERTESVSHQRARLVCARGRQHSYYMCTLKIESFPLLAKGCLAFCGLQQVVDPFERSFYTSPQERREFAISKNETFLSLSAIAHTSSNVMCCASPAGLYQQNSWEGGGGQGW